MSKTNPVCRVCGTLLIVGKNVTQHAIDGSYPICRFCNSARRKEYNHQTGRSQPMFENRECPLFLGVHVAERVLSYVFKNVQRMPINNPGYDFKCGRGYLVDAKCSCRHHHLLQEDDWQFMINKNRIADYFLCLAFDNRNDLNPEHIWLIPAGDVNDKTGASISVTRLEKWQQYEQPLNKVITCCNTLKSDKRREWLARE